MDDLWLFLLKNRFFPLLTGYLEENLLCKAGSEIARHPVEGRGSHTLMQSSCSERRRRISTQSKRRVMQRWKLRKDKCAWMI